MSHLVRTVLGRWPADPGRDRQPVAGGARIRLFRGGDRGAWHGSRDRAPFPAVRPPGARLAGAAGHPETPHNRSSPSAACSVVRPGWSPIASARPVASLIIPRATCSATREPRTARADRTRAGSPPPQNRRASTATRESPSDPCPWCREIRSRVKPGHSACTVTGDDFDLQLNGQALGEAVHPGLGGAVADILRRCAKSRHRRNVDDSGSRRGPRDQIRQGGMR